VQKLSAFINDMLTSLIVQFAKHVMYDFAVLAFARYKLCTLGLPMHNWCRGKTIS